MNENCKKIIHKLLYPPKWTILIGAPVVYVALVYKLIHGQSNDGLAYVIYFLSAYYLVVLAMLIPNLVSTAKRILKHSRVLQKIINSQTGSKYLTDLVFRGSVSIYRGMIMNFLYMIFRTVIGICYASVWSVSIAVYYLALGAIRLFLITRNRQHNKKIAIKSYRQTGWFLLLLNIPMGAMILLMVITDSGFSYPGYAIYLSAMYTFYTVIIAIINLVKFCKLNNPILSAAKIINFVTAIMSVLGLQTAMITQFRVENDNYRSIMNAYTGSAVWIIVIITALYMLVHYKKLEKEVTSLEPLRK